MSGTSFSTLQPPTSTAGSIATVQQHPHSASTSAGADFQIRPGPPRHPMKPISKLNWPDWFRKVWDMTDQHLPAEEVQTKLNALFFESLDRYQQERGIEPQSSGIRSLSVSAAPVSNVLPIMPKPMRKPPGNSGVSMAAPPAAKTTGKSTTLHGAPKPKLVKLTEPTALPSARIVTSVDEDESFSLAKLPTSSTALAALAATTPEANSMLGSSSMLTGGGGTTPDNVDIFSDVVGGGGDLSPTSSLLDDDLLGLTCCKCGSIDASDGNALLECSVCRKMFHQLCHEPPLTFIDPRALFICSKCKSL